MDPTNAAVTMPADATADFAQVPTWALLSLLAFAAALVWLIGFDNGELTRVLDSTGTFFHEFFHDGRHLTGLPCH
jgi:Probable cobalt transporter subunit (CbtB)